MEAVILLVLMLNAPPHAQPVHDEPTARLGAGISAGYLLLAAGDGSGYGFGGGAELSVPVAKHTNVDARVMSWIPRKDYSLYEVRLRHTIGPKRRSPRGYAAAGVAGMYEHGDSWRSPEFLSAGIGLEAPAGPHVIIPLEVSGLISFRNAGAVMVSAGVKWVR